MFGPFNHSPTFDPVQATHNLSITHTQTLVHFCSNIFLVSSTHHQLDGSNHVRHSTQLHAPHHPPSQDCPSSWFVGQLSWTVAHVARSKQSRRRMGWHIPLPARLVESRPEVLVLRKCHPGSLPLTTASLTSTQYIMDGYHVTHDPAQEYMVEPTTQRKLNVIDVPGGHSSKRDSLRSSKRHSKHISTDCAKGRALSPSQIRSPRPFKPGQTAHIVAETYDQSAIDNLQYQFSRTRVSDSSDDESGSDISSDVPSLTSTSSRSSSSSSPSSLSSCTCERYGITRAGNRVKLDCGGTMCGYGDSASSCSDESDGDYRRGMSRRHGVVIRG